MACATRRRARGRRGAEAEHEDLVNGEAEAKKITTAISNYYAQEGRPRSQSVHTHTHTTALSRLSADPITLMSCLSACCCCFLLLLGRRL